MLSTVYSLSLLFGQVTNYLLDTTLLLEEDDTYRWSLEMEPKTSRTSFGQLGLLQSSV